jgi:hypothetical protein
MVKQPNFKTVNVSGDTSSQSLDQSWRSHFQPLSGLSDRLKQHPILFWSLIWIAIALSSGFAVGSLINPNTEIEPAAIAQSSKIKATQPMPQPVPDAGRLPLWVFGAIALSCTASCFILAQYIKPIEMEPAETSVEGEFEETLITMQPTLEERSQPQIGSFHQPSKRLKSYESIEASPFMQLERSPQVQTFAVQAFAVEWIAATPYLEAPLPTNDLVKPVPVPLISLEDTPPLDWGEARLADAMDLRRRYPLQFMANNNSQS